jgi:hypothetical protein
VSWVQGGLERGGNSLGVWVPRARRKLARGSVRPLSEAEIHPRGVKPSSEAEISWCDARPSSEMELRPRGAVAGYLVGR